MADDTTNPFGGAAAGSSGGMFGGGMWGGGGYGMQQPSPYGGGYGGFGGGYGGMQSPYGGGYGGFGGGMPYGGGYGMQSPYGAPGGYGGGYGMQSPYGGGYSPYGMPQGYGGGYGMQQQSAYGPYSAMPQQQTMMAQPQAMAATTAESGGDVTPQDEPGTGGGQTGGSSGGNYAIKTSPWGPQATGLARMWEGSGTGQYPSGTDPNITGAYKELEKQQGLGPLGFDPNSEAALQRMQALAQGGNPMLNASMGAAQGVASGQYDIGTGGMFQSLYNQPGIQNANQYNQLYSHPGVGTGNYQDILNSTGGAGSLSGGMFGQVAKGGLVNGNPFREQAISQAMGDTADQVKATMSARGRYGSDAYGDAMGTALGKVATQARMAGYDTDTANMMAAAQARSGEDLARQGVGLSAAAGIAGAQGQNWQNQLAAAGGLTGVQGQNWQNRLGAANALTGVNSQDIQNRLQAAGMAPAMQGLRYDDASRLLQAGATREQMAQSQRNYGWNQLGQFSNLIGNVPGTAGTTNKPDKPWWEQAAGVAGIVGGMWGGLGGGA